jgi:uncharacterized membrane protein
MRGLVRILRHVFSTRLRTRLLFPPTVLRGIEQACAEAEQRHCGEIRFAIETALPFTALWHGITPRQQALRVFAHLHVWDTQHNNGVLIYVLRADRALEIIADRGINAVVKSDEWESVCRDAEQHFRAGRYAEGARAAVAGVGQLLARHFPAGAGSVNELPNQPVLL